MRVFITGPTCWKTSSPEPARLCISYVDGLSLQSLIGVSGDRDQGSVQFMPDPPCADRSLVLLGPLLAFDLDPSSPGFGDPHAESLTSPSCFRSMQGQAGTPASVPKKRKKEEKEEKEKREKEKKQRQTNDLFRLFRRVTDQHQRQRQHQHQMQCSHLYCDIFLLPTPLDAFTHLSCSWECMHLKTRSKLQTSICMCYRPINPSRRYHLSVITFLFLPF